MKIFINDEPFQLSNEISTRLVSYLTRFYKKAAKTDENDANNCENTIISSKIVLLNFQFKFLE